MAIHWRVCRYAHWSECQDRCSIGERLRLEPDPETLWAEARPLVLIHKPADAFCSSVRG